MRSNSSCWMKFKSDLPIPESCLGFNRYFGDIIIWGVCVPWASGSFILRSISGEDGWPC